MNKTRQQDRTQPWKPRPLLEIQADFDKALEMHDEALKKLEQLIEQLRYRSGV